VREQAVNGSLHRVEVVVAVVGLHAERAECRQRRFAAGRVDQVHRVLIEEVVTLAPHITHLRHEAIA